MSLPIMIRRAREAAGISQRDLARRLGVHHSAVWQWEEGQSLPDIQHRIELSIMLGIRFTDLLPESAGRVVLVTDPQIVAIVELFERLSGEVRQAWLQILQATLASQPESHKPPQRTAARRVAKAD